METLSQKNAIHNYFQPIRTSSESETIVKCLLNDLITQAVSDIADIAIRIVNEVVDSAFDSAQKPTAHSGNRVGRRTFKEWSEKFPWLLIQETESKINLCCKICQEQKETLKLTNVWAFEGSPSIQISSLCRHNESNEHKNACISAEKAKSKAQINICEETIIETGNVTVSESDLKLFRTVYFTAKSELPSESINGLLNLQKMNGVEMPYQNLSWDSITEIQRSISFVLKADLVSEIKTSVFYGLMIDESTDLTVDKRLSVCIRYVKNGEPLTKFLCNVPLEDGKATTIVNSIVKTFEQLGLSLSACVSLATDGASVMTGKKAGVGVQLQSKYAPFCIQTHCIAHRLNLACTDTIKKDDFMVKFRDKFGSLYFFMSGSSLRTQTLKKIQAIFEEPEISVKEPHSIRWLGLKNAVEAVFVSYSSVMATLARFAEDKNSTAKGLHKYFNSYKVALVTAFMLDVHTELAVLSCQFQKQNLLFSEVHPLVQGTLAKLETMKSVDGAALTEMKQKLSVESDEATLNGEKVSYNKNMDKEFETLRSNYIKSLQKNIKLRLKKKDTDLIEDLSKVFEPDLVNSLSDSECSEAAEHLSAFYGYDNEVKVVHGDMLEGVETEERTIHKVLNPEQLQQEWPRLKGMINGAYSSLSTVLLCKRIVLLHSDILPNFAILANIALCMQLTSVDCERSFSTQNRLKSKYRAALGSEKLDILLTISMIGPDVTNFNLEPAITHWLRKKRRKNRLFADYKPRAKKQKVC